MYRYTKVLQSPPDVRLFLWFEPWAEGYAFPPNAKVELHAQSTIEGELDLLEERERTAVYGWSGCTLKVIVDNEVVVSFDQSVPEFSQNTSTKEMMTLLLGEAPKPKAEEMVSATKRPWWRRLWS